MRDQYDVLEHGLMVGDRRRIDAYLEAIRRAVRPGDVVVDLGTGTGVFAVAACRAGAARVYAIEPGDIISVAREVAAVNGCGSRVEFIQRLSADVTLPERADILVVDVRGVLPDEQIPIVADARRRFLKDEGVVIPARDAIWIAPVTSPELYERHVGRDEDGVDLGPAQDRAAKRWYKCQVAPRDLIADPCLFATVDYATNDSDVVRAGHEWEMREPATSHGLVGWFESTLHGGVTLSNRPGAPPLLYGNAYFPLREPMPLRAGDTVSVALAGHMADDSYRWDWTVAVRGTLR